MMVEVIDHKARADVAVTNTRLDGHEAVCLVNIAQNTKEHKSIKGWLKMLSLILLSVGGAIMLAMWELIEMRLNDMGF